MATDDLGLGLLRASRCGDLAEVERILDLSGNDFIETRYKSGHTSLMVASYRGYTEIVKLLLKKGANVNSVDNDGYTCLMVCSFDGYDIVELLLEKGASRYGGPACSASLRMQKRQITTKIHYYI